MYTFDGRAVIGCYKFARGEDLRPVGTNQVRLPTAASLIARPVGNCDPISEIKMTEGPAARGEIQPTQFSMGPDRVESSSALDVASASLPILDAPCCSMPSIKNDEVSFIDCEYNRPRSHGFINGSRGAP